jgi:hypothetical protein
MLGITRGDLRLVCGYSAMETHFMKLLTKRYCADVLLPEAVWNSVLSVANEDRHFFCHFFHQNGGPVL